MQILRLTHHGYGSSGAGFTCNTKGPLGARTACNTINKEGQYVCFMCKFGCLNQGLKLAERLNKATILSV